MKQRLLLLFMLVLPFIGGNVLGQTYHVVEPNVDGTSYEAYEIYYYRKSSNEWMEIANNGTSNNSYQIPEGANGFINPPTYAGGVSMQTSNYCIFHVTNCTSVAILFEGTSNSRGMILSVTDTNGQEVAEELNILNRDITVLEYGAELEPNSNYIVTVRGNDSGNSRFYQIRFEAPSGPVGPSNNASITNMNVNGNIISQNGTTFSASIPNNYSALTVPVQFSIHSAASVIVDGTSVESNNGNISTEVNAPEELGSYDVVVTAEDGTIANYELIIVRQAPQEEGIIFHERFSNFTTALTNNALRDGNPDEEGYGEFGSGSAMKCEEDGTLTLVGGRFITRTLDLTGDVILYVTYKTNTEESNKSFMVNLDFTGGSSTNAIFSEKSALSPLEYETREIAIVGGTSSSYLQFRVESGHEIVLKEIKIVRIGGANISTGIINEDGTVEELTAESLAGRTYVRLIGELTEEHVSLLNEVELTSIDLEKVTLLEGVLSPINPNCVIFASQELNLTTSNLVVNGIAANINLTDGYSFNNPKVFTAETISYTRNFTVAGWASICLPFDIEVSALEGIEAVQAFTSAEESTIYFTNVSAFEANTPYIANIASIDEITFTSTNVAVPATKMNDVTHGDYTFKGTYTTIDGHNHYGLHSNGKGFGVGGPESTLAAFRAYIDGSSIGTDKLLVIGNKDDDDDTTGIEDTTVNGLLINSMVGGLEIISSESQEISIYSLDGRWVNKTFINEGQTTVTGLQKGIYLLNNQKVVVR